MVFYKDIVDVKEYGYEYSSKGLNACYLVINFACTGA